MTQTAVDRVERAFARLDEVEAQISSVCTINDAARDQARALDQEAREGHSRGPLHGQVVVVKDNIDTADLPTTVGSLAFADQPPPARDALLVERMREAGLVLVGKANLSEWANIRDGSSTSGWSAYGGLTRNPHALNRSAGGSSSGSGAAVAAGITRFAVGTETDGSITCPAAFNGCVGFKPTVGLVPTAGVAPVSRSQDSPGPLTTSVREAAALLEVMSGLTDLGEHAVEGRLSGKRIGVPRRDYWGYSPHADEAAERAVRLLAAEGATIVDETNLDSMTDFGGEDEVTVMLAELRSGLADYLASRPGDGPRTLAELVEFNRRHAATELRHFGQSLFERSLDGPADGDEDYRRARARCLEHARDAGIDAVLRAHDLDALVTPSYAPASPIDLVNPEWHSGACTQPTAMAGYPLLTVPSGMAAGLPVAVSFWGTAHSERTLLEIGHGYEQARLRSTGPMPAPALTPFV